MKLQVRLGPPASGRTAAMVELARAACLRGERVWWLGLPAQRAGIFRRVTAAGFTALGLEVMSSQQMYYRLLAGPDFVDLEPLLVGTARLVRVAEALAASLGGLPSPGEVKLFAAAIAEAKRFGLGPEDVAREAKLAGDDVEIVRLAEVFGTYQASMVNAWDYDDVRAQAAELVASERFASLMADDERRRRATLPELVIVDGLRELGPLDLQVLVELGELTAVHLTLPEPPQPFRGVDAESYEVEEMTPAAEAVPAKVVKYLAPNVVAEARFVMRSLKRDLAIGAGDGSAGFDPLDLGVVATPGTAAAILALTDEYGVPLMDEAPRALADTPEGATLLDLLELAALPTASRLLAIPELAPLAAAALRMGVAGADAITLVARELDVEDRWRWWLAKLRVGEDPVAWTKWLLSEVLVLVHPEPAAGFITRVLTMAQEAAVLARGEGFAVWLAALLRDARSRSNAPGGISVLDAKLVSGRRFKRLYVMGAVEGAYRAGEREDYFISEDLRGVDEGADEAVDEGADEGVDEDVVERERIPDEYPGAGQPDARLPFLPRRFKGRDEVVAAELLSRADVTIVTAPQAGPQGTLTPDVRLFGEEDDRDDVSELPPVPAGSVLELGGTTPFRPAIMPVDRWWQEADGGVGAEFLKWYDDCAFRSWGEATLMPVPAPNELPEQEPEWRLLLHGLTAEQNLTAERIRELGASFPDFAPWLEQHAERLTRLNWGVNFKHLASGASAYVHAGERLPVGSRGRQKFMLYRFVAPTSEETDWNWGRQQQGGRWAEYLAADAAMQHRSQAPAFVEIVVWPLLGEPLTVDRTSNDFVAGRLIRTSEQATDANRRLHEGDVFPRPGFHCRYCPVFETCREGRRT